VELSRLAAAYRHVFARARATTGSSGDLFEGWSNASWLIAQLWLCDRILLRAAIETLHGRSAQIHNSTVSDKAVGSLITAHSQEELLDMAEGNAEELLDILRQIPQEHSGKLVQVRLVDRSGTEIFNDWLAWRDLIEFRADEQLPTYTTGITSRP
jgi:hypothetical protein